MAGCLPTSCYVPSLFSRWQALSNNGERAWRCGQFSLAKLAWQEAALLAQQFLTASAAVEQLSAFHTSQHQLAKLALRQAKPEQAAHHYCQAINRLREWTSTLPPLEQSQIHQHFQQTLQALAELAEQGVHTPQMDTLMAATANSSRT